MFDKSVARLKLRGWMIPFVVVVTAGCDYLRKDPLSITGLVVVALMTFVFVCITKLPPET